ncbi:MAG: SPOR domain-containing protein, partial [Desulfovibrio sp.]|nr:SPOR domain-containing protein [Desulfovibrio sp.]
MTGERKNAEESGKGKRLARVSLSSLLTLCFLAIVAVATAYIGGVMSGRHMGGDDKPSTPSAREIPAPVSGDSSKINEIIAAEDLEFARVLRGEPRRKTEKPAPASESPGASSGDGAAAENHARADGTRENETAKETEAGPASPPKQPSTMRDYVFQAGAFRDEASADSLRWKLEGYGLRTRLEKKNKFYIVL